MIFLLLAFLLILYLDNLAGFFLFLIFPLIVMTVGFSYRNEASETMVPPPATYGDFIPIGEKNGVKRYKIWRYDCEREIRLPSFRRPSKETDLAYFECVAMKWHAHNLRDADDAFFLFTGRHLWEWTSRP